MSWLLLGTLLPGTDVVLEQKQWSPSVSLVALIAHPAPHDGEHLSVVGFVSTEYEDEMLYLHREDHDNAIMDNGVRLGLPIALRQQVNSGQYVRAQGVFHLGSKGGTSSGRDNWLAVERLEPWLLAEDRT